MELDFNEIINNTNIVSGNRNYWLVRSMGGDYYNDFQEGGYIAIGYEKILLKDIKYSNSLGPEAQKTLSEIVLSRYSDPEDNINSNYAAAQLLKFSNSINDGDIVIVPGRSQDRLVSIGIVQGKIYEENENDIDDCPFVKRLKVKWIVNNNRSSLNPHLQLIFNSRHIVSNINDYAEFIDCASGDFFRKENLTYLVLKVNNQSDITSSDFMFIGDLLELTQQYSDENDLDIDIKDIKMKVCVQSPGDFILFAKSPAGITIFGLLIILINGGGFKIDHLGVDVSTKGIITNISNFLDRRKDRKMQEALIKKINNLEITNPQALLDIIKETKNEREKY